MTTDVDNPLFHLCVLSVLSVVEFAFCKPIDTLVRQRYELRWKKVQVTAMRFRCVFLIGLLLSGCAGFDDYYARDGWVMEGYPASPSCGCATAPHSAPPMAPHTPPPPLGGGPTVTPVSGSAMSPQTREPELLR